MSLSTYLDWSSNTYLVSFGLVVGLRKVYIFSNIYRLTFAFELTW